MCRIRRKRQHGQGGENSARKERPPRSDRVPKRAGDNVSGEQRQAADQIEYAEGRAAQFRRRGFRHQRREQPLREAHVKAPEHDADTTAKGRLRKPAPHPRRSAAEARRSGSPSCPCGRTGCRRDRPTVNRRGSARTSTTGTSANGRPIDCARRTRNASLDRASVKIAATATTRRQAASRRRSSSRRNGIRTCATPFGRSGSLTATRMSATDRNAGMTEIQNTVWKWFAVSHIRPIARTGPTKAPIVSSDWRRPKLAPRSSGGAISATSASRGRRECPCPYDR